MPTNQATVTELGRRMLRPLTADETAWAGTALDDAFRQILVEIPDVGATLDDPALPSDAPYRQVVVQVTCAMLIRVLQNPDGVLEETIDDHTRRLDAALSTGQLQLTDGERALLSAGTGQPEGAFAPRAVPTVAAVRDWFPSRTDDVWPPMSGSVSW